MIAYILFEPDNNEQRNEYLILDNSHVKGEFHKFQTLSYGFASAQLWGFSNSLRLVNDLAKWPWLFFGVLTIFYLTTHRILFFLEITLVKLDDSNI